MPSGRPYPIGEVGPRTFTNNRLRRGRSNYAYSECPPCQWRSQLYRTNDEALEALIHHGHRQH